MTLSINTTQLLNELETLAGFSDAPAPAVTRVVFSETDRRARGYVKELCTSAGLAVREQTEDKTADLLQDSGVAQLGEHAVDPMELLMDVFEHQDCAVVTGAEARPQARNHERQVASQQAALGAATDSRAQPFAVRIVQRADASR